MDDLAFNQLEEREAQAEVAFNSCRHVAKDKETAVRVVDVLESIERGHDGASQGAMCGCNNFARGIAGVDEVAAHEQIGAL